MFHLKSILSNVPEEGMTTTAHDGHEFSDKDVAKYVAKHLKIIDRFSVRKVVLASQIAFDIFLGEAKMVTEKQNWKFFTDDATFEWIEED